MSKDTSPQKNKNNKRYLILLIVNTVLFFTVYRTLISFGEQTQETFYSFVCIWEKKTTSSPIADISLLTEFYP